MVFPKLSELSRIEVGNRGERAARENLGPTKLPLAFEARDRSAVCKQLIEVPAVWLLYAHCRSEQATELSDFEGRLVCVAASLLQPGLQT